MKKKIFIILIIVAITFNMFGCKFVFTRTVIEGTATEQEAVYDDGPVGEEPILSGVLELEIWTNESESMSNAWTEVIDEFEKDTGVEVTAHIGSQVVTQLAPRWRDGNPPDAALLAGTIPIEAWERDGKLYDLTEVLEEGYIYGTQKKISDYVSLDGSIRAGKNGECFRAAFMASPYGVLYDSNYIVKYGKAPENYTELKEFSEKVIAGGDAVFTTYGNTGSYPTWAMILPAIAAYGEELLNEVLKGNPQAWQSEEVKTVLGRWREFCNTEGVLTEGTATFDHTTSQIKWLNHESVLIGNGIWLPAEVENITPKTFSMEYVSSPLISENQTPTVLAIASAMLVAKQAKNLENAKAFIRYLYTKKAQTILTTGHGYMGVRNDMNYAELPGMSDAASSILGYIFSENVNIVWQKYTWGDLNDTVNGATHGLMTGRMTVDQAVNSIVAMTEKLKSENKLFY